MMTDDFDVEEMLEAPFAEKSSRSNNNNNHHHSSDKRHREERDRDRDRDRKSRRSRDRDDKKRRSSKSRSRSKSKERGGSRHKRSRSRSHDRKHGGRGDRRDGGRGDKRDRSRSPRRRDHREHHRRNHRDGRGRGSPSPIRFIDRSSRRRYDRSRSRSRPHDLTPEERDQRTVFCMQLCQKVTSRDLEEFFSSVGRVREVRLIMDNKTRRHKGIAYIEFYDISSVPLALALNHQRLQGYPIIIQPTQAEKNRAAAAASAIVQKAHYGPMKLYVGSLHFNITEDMLKGIFEPFGRIEKIELMRDPENNRSKGYGFITFCDGEDAKKALEQLNGFELAGRPMKVNHVSDRNEPIPSYSNPSLLDSEETDRTGIDLGTTGRLHLMAKLAEGTGIKLPQAAVTALQMGQVAIPNSAAIAQSVSGVATTAQVQSSSIMATQCFMLNNMFDPYGENSEDWEEEIKNDVLDECRKHGGVLHVHVDRQSQGNVYVKCPSVAIASSCVQALHGRWFSGRLVTAAYVPLPSYHTLFPDSLTSTSPL